VDLAAAAYHHPTARMHRFRRTPRMFLAKVDLAALLLHSFSAGITAMLLVYAEVIGDGSLVAHVLSMGLFLVNVGSVWRILWRGEHRRPRHIQASPSPTDVAPPVENGEGGSSPARQ
jgi:hypothetical protein